MSLSLLRCNPGPYRVDPSLGNTQEPAQDFPVFAKHLPLTKFARKSQFWEYFNLLFFNNLKRASIDKGCEDVIPSCPLGSTGSYEQPTRQNPSSEYHFLCSHGAIVHYSYRRISTGKSRAADRAGNIVAPIEMAIAATAIHTPSNTLG